MISKGGPWCSRSQGRRRCKSEATQASEPRFDFFLKGSFVLQISRRETSPSVKVKLVNHIQLGVWRMKNDANIFWFHGFVDTCVFFVIVFLFATGTSFKSKANTNHRCAPSSPTLTPRLKTNWPLRVQPYGGPYLRLYLFSMYNLFDSIDSVWVQPYGWPNYLPFGVFVFFNIFIFIVWTIWGAIPWMLIMWLSLSLRIIVIVFAYVKTFILIMTVSLSESIRNNQNKTNR